MTPPEAGSVTTLIRGMQAGDAAARDRLFARVNDELRRQAEAMLKRRGVRRGVIQGTDLFNMACVNLLAREALDAEDRTHFFGIVGRKMRDVLADLAREAGAAKRGGGAVHEPLVEIEDPGGPRSVPAHALARGLAALEEVDPLAARTVQMHVMAGRTLAETATLLGSTKAKVRSNVKYGLAFIRSRLEEAEC